MAVRSHVAGAPRKYVVTRCYIVETCWSSPISPRPHWQFLAGARCRRHEDGLYSTKRTEKWSRWPQGRKIVASSLKSILDIIRRTL